MAHLPPKMTGVSPEEPHITIQGIRHGGGQDRANTIEIILPELPIVKTSMSIELGINGGIATVKSEAIKLETEPAIPRNRKFDSIITRIELANVTRQGTTEWEFIPKDNNGKCTIKIFFDHPN